MKKIKCTIVFLVCTLGNLSALNSSADELTQQIVELDTNLYTDFNACNKTALKIIYDKNVKIYDGKKGLMSFEDFTGKSFTKNCKKNITEPIAKTLAVYPLNNFGAILTGEQELKKKDKVLSTNQYIHVYQYQQQEWKISRVFTYDFMSAKLGKYRLKDNGLYQKIAALDKSVFDTFNSCDIEKHKTFFTDDFEFYHDKGGLTSPLKNFIDNTEKYVCGKGRARMRRELVTESLKVYPLDSYGAIAIGEHKFYQTDPGQKERVTEIAKFVCVWTKADRKWKMSHSLSYDHVSLE